MPPTSDQVRGQLDRLLASSVFANAGRMSRFLKFIVEQTLAGDGERLKEYVIGVEVFDRAANYDPRVDAIVRVEAARLRTKLSEYYAGEGRSDDVVLSLPKGGYAPRMKLESHSAGPANGAAAPAHVEPQPPVPPVAAAAAPRRLRGWLLAGAIAAAVTLAVAPWATRVAAPAKPRVAVLPFEPYPDSAGAASDSLAMRITAGVTAELVHDGRFAVVASSAASAAASAAKRPRDLAEELGADVLIQARITTTADRVNVEARAATAAEQKFWVDELSGSAADTDALERAIAAAIAAALGADRD
jgi:TolB-like protein